MGMTFLIHILAGSVGIISGFVALYAAKGARLHRKGGMVFVFAMVTMAMSGAFIAAVRGQEANLIAGLLTAYLVITGLLTVRPVTSGSRRLGLGALAVGLVATLISLGLAFAAIARGGNWEGIPAPVLFMFGIVGTLAIAGDLRMMRTGPPVGVSRLSRHLWRLCFALYIASASFFLGQADEFPEALRNPALLAVPVLAPLLAMLYWLWRLRIRRKFRGITDVSARGVNLSGEPGNT